MFNEEPKGARREKEKGEPSPSERDEERETRGNEREAKERDLDDKENKGRDMKIRAKITRITSSRKGKSRPTLLGTFRQRPSSVTRERGNERNNKMTAKKKI